MAEFLLNLDYWHWFLAGLVLLSLEVLAPGTIFLWFGVAALCVGVIAFFVPLSWRWEVLLFAILACAFLFLGRRYFRVKRDVQAKHSINRRMDSLIGRQFKLSEAITNGTGRVKIDDTFWRVRGNDTPKGTSIRVVRVDGVELFVETADE